MAWLQSETGESRRIRCYPRFHDLRTYPATETAISLKVRAMATMNDRDDRDRLRGWITSRRDQRHYSYITEISERADSQNSFYADYQSTK